MKFSLSLIGLSMVWSMVLGGTCNYGSYGANTLSPLAENKCNVFATVTAAGSSSISFRFTCGANGAGGEVKTYAGGSCSGDAVRTDSVPDASVSCGNTETDCPVVVLTQTTYLTTGCTGNFGQSLYYFAGNASCVGGASGGGSVSTEYSNNMLSIDISSSSDCSSASTTTYPTSNGDCVDNSITSTSSKETVALDTGSDSSGASLNGLNSYFIVLTIGLLSLFFTSS